VEGLAPAQALVRRSWLRDHGLRTPRGDAPLRQTNRSPGPAITPRGQCWQRAPRTSSAGKSRFAAMPCRTAGRWGGDFDPASGYKRDGGGGGREGARGDGNRGRRGGGEDGATGPWSRGDPWVFDHSSSANGERGSGSFSKKKSPDLDGSFQSSVNSSIRQPIPFNFMRSAPRSLLSR